MFKGIKNIEELMKQAAGEAYSNITYRSHFLESLEQKFNIMKNSVKQFEIDAELTLKSMSEEEKIQDQTNIKMLGKDIVALIDLTIKIDEEFFKSNIVEIDAPNKLTDYSNKHKKELQEEKEKTEYQNKLDKEINQKREDDYNKRNLEEQKEINNEN